MYVFDVTHTVFVVTSSMNATTKSAGKVGNTRCAIHAVLARKSCALWSDEKSAGISLGPRKMRRNFIFLSAVMTKYLGLTKQLAIYDETQFFFPSY